MNENEAVLLRRFTRTGDAEAFAEITRRYAGMVYGVCLRVTGNVEHARDATQDTFFQLLKSAGKVTGSLGGWLHQVATRRAVDLIRRNSARRQREQTFATDTLPETDVWSDVSPLVDEAINEIEPEQRDLLLRHFLQGETTVSMAAAAGMSQPTMSRRVEGALEQLRDCLRKKGVGVAAAALGTMMAGTAQEAPAIVLAELGKMALVTTGTAAASTATATALGLNAKLAIAATIAVVGVGGFVAYKATRPAKPALPALAEVLPATTPGAQVVIVDRPGNPQTVPGTAPSPATTKTPVQGPAGFALMGDTAQRQRFGNASAATGGRAFGAGGFGAGATMGLITTGGPTTTRATPQGALTLFVSALMRGDPVRLNECFEGTVETNALRRMIESPASDEERALQQAFQSLGPPVEVLGTTALEDGLGVKCRATVRKPFTLVKDGAARIWQPGDWYELEVRLTQIGAEWKLTGL